VNTAPAIAECRRCGAPLDGLSLPISRRDKCPSCGVPVHACKQCRFYDPAVSDQCREDDAERVSDKDTANFCDYFQLGAGRFDAGRSREAERSQSALDALFGAAGPVDDADADSALSDAEKLFRDG
jgi:hypothetical protein